MDDLHQVNVQMIGDGILNNYPRDQHGYHHDRNRDWFPDMWQVAGRPAPQESGTQDKYCQQLQANIEAIFVSLSGDIQHASNDDNSQKNFF